MAKIIRFDHSRRQHEVAEPVTSCDHKNVVAFTVSRTVQCAICGARLDPFDVMLELLKGYMPPIDNNRVLKTVYPGTEPPASRKASKVKKIDRPLMKLSEGAFLPPLRLL